MVFISAETPSEPLLATRSGLLSLFVRARMMAAGLFPFPNVGCWVGSWPDEPSLAFVSI